MSRRALLREFRIRGIQVRVFVDKDSLRENAARPVPGHQVSVTFELEPAYCRAGSVSFWEG